MDIHTSYIHTYMCVCACAHVHAHSIGSVTLDNLVIIDFHFFGITPFSFGSLSFLTLYVIIGR